MSSAVIIILERRCPTTMSRRKIPITEDESTTEHELDGYSLPLGIRGVSLNVIIEKLDVSICTRMQRCMRDYSDLLSP